MRYLAWYLALTTLSRRHSPTPLLQEHPGTCAATSPHTPLAETRLLISLAPSLTHPAVARAHMLSCCLALALTSPSRHLAHPGTRATSPRPSRPSPTIARPSPCRHLAHTRRALPHQPSLSHSPRAAHIPTLTSLLRRHSPIPLDGHTRPRTASPTLADARPLLLRAVSPTLVPTPPHMVPSPSRPASHRHSPTPPLAPLADPPPTPPSHECTATSQSLARTLSLASHPFALTRPFPMPPLSRAPDHVHLLHAHHLYSIIINEIHFPKKKAATISRGSGDAQEMLQDAENAH